MLQKILIPPKKTFILFPLTFTMTKEPPGNNMYQQSFSQNTQVEKCFENVKSISSCNF